MYIWGLGVFGEIFSPQLIQSLDGQVRDVAVGASFSACIDDSGQVWTWGTNTRGELGLGDADPRMVPFPVIALKGKNVEQISCGGQFSMAIGKSVPKRETANPGGASSVLRKSRSEKKARRRSAEKKKPKRKRRFRSSWKRETHALQACATRRT